jgi:hypothetical protein
MPGGKYRMPAKPSRQDESESYAMASRLVSRNTRLYSRVPGCGFTLTRWRPTPLGEAVAASMTIAVQNTPDCVASIMSVPWGLEAPACSAVSCGKIVVRR